MSSAAVSALLHDRALIESIPPLLWKELFEAFGYPTGLSANDLEHETIAAAIAANDTIAPALLESLQNVHDLSDDAGRDALLDAANEGGIDLSDLRDASPIDAAVHAVTRAHGSTDLARIVRLALVTIHERRSPETVKEYAGNAPRALSAKSVDRQAVEQDLRAWFESLGMGTHAHVHIDGRSDGTVSMLIIHGHRTLSQLVVNGDGRHMIEFRPAHCDVLRYDPESGRLRITARVDRLVQKYREIAGAAFFNDRSWFAGETLWDLRPLAERGRERLAIDSKRNPKIAEVKLVEVLWVTPHGNKIILRGDVFEEAEAQGLRLREGEIVEAKLRLRFTCERPNRATVVVRTPNRAKIPARFEGPVMAFLSDVGIRLRPGSATARELWSLGGGPRAADDWASAYGAEVEAMLHEGILVRASLAAIEHPNHPGRRGALDVRQIEDVDGRTIAYGIGSDVPSRMLTTSDVEGIALDQKRLATLVARELGAVGNVAETVMSGTFALGHLEIGNERVQPFLVLREPLGPMVNFVRIATAGGRPVLLVPPGCTTSSGLPEVTLHRHAPPFDESLMPMVVEKLGLTEVVEAIHLAPKGTLLIVDCISRRAWLEGEPLTALENDQRFRWLELVTYETFMRRPPLSSGDLSAELSHGPEAHKRVKSEVRAAIEKSFALNGKPLPDIVAKDLFPSAGAGNGYRVAASVWVRGIPRRR